MFILPLPAAAADVYPIVSVSAYVGPYVWSNLITDMNDTISVNYTAICRSNCTSAYVRLDFFDKNHTIVDSNYFSIDNFTIFSFRLQNESVGFSAVAENLAGNGIIVYFDLYDNTIENLQGMTLLIAPVINPTEFIYVTNNITIIQEHVVTKEVPIISDFQAILIGFGGVCVLGVYIMVKTNKEKEKPIKKLTLDDLFDEYREKHKK